MNGCFLFQGKCLQQTNKSKTIFPKEPIVPSLYPKITPKITPPINSKGEGTGAPTPSQCLSTSYQFRGRGNYWFYQSFRGGGRGENHFLWYINSVPWPNHSKPSLSTKTPSLLFQSSLSRQPNHQTIREIRSAVKHCLCLFVYVPLCVSLCVYLSECVYLCVSLSECVCLSTCVSLCVSLCMCVSLCVSLCIPTLGCGEKTFFSFIRSLHKRRSSPFLHFHQPNKGPKDQTPTRHATGWALCVAKNRNALTSEGMKILANAPQRKHIETQNRNKILSFNGRIVPNAYINRNMMAGTQETSNNAGSKTPMSIWSR